MDTGLISLMLITAASLFILQDIFCAPTTDDQKSGHLTGQALIEMGTKLNKPLLRLIGKALTNVENEIMDISVSRRKVVEEICRLHHCSPWSEWSKCDATTLGEFGGQNRNRNCGFNTTLCERFAETSVEYDYKMCEYTCPDDYTVTQHRLCLKLYYTAKKQRDDAEAVCQSDGGHLVNVDSFEKVHDVNATLAEQSFTDRIWIDGRRSVQAGPWKYGYKPVDPSFTFWGGNDPDNGASDLCILYIIDSSHGKSWRKFDFSCSSSYDFMCEIVV